MIGIFDSGLGGLTVLNKLIKIMPDYDYIYFADSARAPYGGKSRKEIYSHTEEAVKFLFKKNCRLIILACNTASAVALRKLQRGYLKKNYPQRRILGVIIPNLETIIDTLNCSRKKKIGIIGTKMTIKSRVYEKELKKIIKNLKIYNKYCPELVPLIESDFSHTNITETILKKYLKPLQKKNIDMLVLACTHYPILNKQIKKITNNKIKILDTSNKLALKTKYYLKRHPEIEKKLSKKGQRVFYSTGNIILLKKFTAKYLKIKNGLFSHISLKTRSES